MILSQQTYEHAAKSIEIPVSKSIANRVLIIEALLGKKTLESNAVVDDTTVLINALSSTERVLDVGHAGTAYRFLVAFLAMQSKTTRLTGSDRMKERPIKPLVDALKYLGAKITYLEKEGFPPLEISGNRFLGNKVKIHTQISSQFMSALLLIAPQLPQGLTISWDGQLVSKPYVDMTVNLMRVFGAQVKELDQKIVVASQPYQFATYQVERDWSAMAFWYNLMLVHQIPELTIPHLTKDSIQGDAAVVRLYKPFGITTTFKNGDAHLFYKKVTDPNFPTTYDFTHVPDITLAFLVSMAAINHSVKITGVGHLQFKETNRLQALKNELQKFGAIVHISSNAIELEKGISTKMNVPLIEIETYKDHRMAMAFAPLCKFYSLKIVDPAVVSKSYPQFWKELEKLA